MDHDRLAEELEALHPHSFGWAMACCDRHREDAEDVLHDVYVKVLSGKAHFDGRATFRTWVFGVIRLTAAEQRRSIRIRAFLFTTASLRMEVPASPASPEKGAIDVDSAERTERALMQLSARQREVLQLVFYHDLTIEEAATVMKVSIGTARTHYERGKARMLTLLGGEKD